MRLRRLLLVGLVMAGPVLLAAEAVAQKPPEEALAALAYPSEFEAATYASEPMITNPAAIDVDTHGRVWVAEIQWYRRAAKQPPADSIKVLEDTDGDGVADKSTVFADGIFAPMSICVAGDKVYVATSPDLWVYEDTDGDLKADGPPEKLLTGFGGFNHDHGAHSLVLGPDHKWWMSHGDTGFDVTGTDGSHIKYRWGAMLRGELDGSELEIVAENFRNPYEIAVSSFGEAFCSDNDNDGNFSVRICWIMEGGDYGWFGRPPGKRGSVPPSVPFSEHWHFRGHIPGHVPALLVTGFGSPCGMCFYEGDAFGPGYKNYSLHTDAGPREVRVYRHRLEGYGMAAEQETFLTSQDDKYFRPDDICAAPDGRLYVSDWYDGGVGGHAYNNPNQGRIYVLTPKGKQLERPAKPGPYDNIPDAIEGLKSPNLATQYLAREQLLSAGREAEPALVKLFDAEDQNFHARALWLLDRIGGESRRHVLDHLKHEQAEFRALAVRILRRYGGEYASAILQMADDKSPEVKREVLLAIQDIDTPEALDTLAQLAQQYDGTDRYQLEAINIAAGERKSELVERLNKAGKWRFEQLALMQVLDPKAAAEFVAARLSQGGLDPKLGESLLTAAGSIESPEAGRSLLKLVANEKAPAGLRRLALEKLSSNLDGSWKSLRGDEAFLKTLRGALDDVELRPTALDVIETNGLSALAGDVLKLTATKGATVESRQQAIRTAVALRSEGTAEALRKLLDSGEASVQAAALAALADLQDFETMRNLLSGDKYPPALKQRAVEQLMSSTGGALVLLRLIDDKKLPAGLKESVIAKAVEHPDSNIRVLYERFIPEDQRPKRLGETIKPEELLAMKGDAERGQAIFFQSSAAQCNNCHVVQGKGGTLGPDLSQIGKKYAPKALLETILDPSKAIAPEYTAYLLETDAGQVYAGFLVEHTDEQVVLKDAKSQLIRVPAEQVVALVKQDKSLMPELVLRDVTAQDAADLLAYLETLNEGVQSVGAFRVAGPFKLPQSGNRLDVAFGPEKSPGDPDLSAKFDLGFGKQKAGWELVTADTAQGFPAFDTVKFDQRKKLPTEYVAHYFLLFADSVAEQEVGLLVGSDDGVKLWVNGELVHENNVSRAVGFGQDRVRATLASGRNVILMKVINGNGPGGAALGVSSSAPVQLKTE